jgi:N-acetylglucosamine kinase-like BadF-type ATPase
VSGPLLGVDGGATKTIALVVDDAGGVLGAGRAGSSDIHSESPPSRAIDNIVSGVQKALDAAGADAGDLGACAFGLCGADWPEDMAFYADQLRARLALREPPIIVNDAFNSLRAGTDDGVGVAVVLGTGGAIAARGPSGATWFSGERMERSGALELGRVIFDSLVRAEYADGPHPAYEPAALGVFDAGSIEELVYTITHSGGTGYRSVARLAPALLQAADAGDPASLGVVREHSGRIAAFVRAAGRRVGADDRRLTVVLAGGLLRGRSTSLIRAFHDTLPGHEVSVCELEPVHGAVLMAADQAGQRLSRERVAQGGPPPGLFST